MRLKLLAVMAAGLAASPAFAQADPGAAPPDAAPAQVHHHHHHHHHAHATTASSGGEKPVDVGPNTPQANAAYQGGGVVLQGAPGAPAPRPQATPPGQTPANSVPP